MGGRQLWGLRTSALPSLLSSQTPWAYRCSLFCAFSGVYHGLATEFGAPHARWRGAERHLAVGAALPLLLAARPPKVLLPFVGCLEGSRASACGLRLALLPRLRRLGVHRRAPGCCVALVWQSLRLIGHCLPPRRLQSARGWLVHMLASLSARARGGVLLLRRCRLCVRLRALGCCGSPAGPLLRLAGLRLLLAFFCALWAAAVLSLAAGRGLRLRLGARHRLRGRRPRGSVMSTQGRGEGGTHHGTRRRLRRCK